MSALYPLDYPNNAIAFFRLCSTLCKIGMALSSVLEIRWKLNSYNPYVVSILALLGIQVVLSFVYNTNV
jgi:hypothetical protein